jgi:uncharacterized protein HemX
MVLLGLLLILACAAVAVDAVLQNGGAVHATVFGHALSGLSVGTLFVAGAVTGLLFALGLALVMGGVGRASRARRERRALRRQSQHAAELRAENERLEELLAERETSTDGDSAYPSEPAGGTADYSPTTDTTVGGRHRR